MGGVREHCVQVIKQLFAHPGVDLTHDYANCDLVHVQTAWKPPENNRIDVWTCHGGFVPPIAQVRFNLRACRTIISVAKWVADVYFPEENHKTIIIPNGIDLTNWEELPSSKLRPGFWLWGQHQLRDDWWHFYELAKYFPSIRFVSTLSHPDAQPLQNLKVIGIQPREAFRSIINDCNVYVSTGSEVCPTMVLEAWACNKPVLAWNAHGNKELVEERSNGVVTRLRGGYLYGDMTEMFAAAWQLLQGAGSVDYGGRQIVEEHFQWKDVAQRIVEVYESLL